MSAANTNELPAVYGSSLGPAQQQLIAKIRSACGQWPHEFLGPASPPSWPKALLDLLSPLVTRAVQNGDFATLVEYLCRAQPLTVDRVRKAKSWYNDRRALGRATRLSSSGREQQEEENETPDYEAQTISSNLKRKNPFPEFPRRRRQTPDAGPAEPGSGNQSESDQNEPLSSDDLIHDAFVEMMRRKCARREEDRRARLAAIAAEAETLRGKIMGINRSPIAEVQGRLKKLAAWQQVLNDFSRALRPFDQPLRPRALPSALATTEEDIAENLAATAKAEAELADAEAA
ncbi:hypothetical protein ACHAQK_009274 [Fusarium lateritium]